MTQPLASGSEDHGTVILWHIRNLGHALCNILRGHIGFVLSQLLLVLKME